MEKLVPKLRFPEFEGNWIANKLGNFAEVSKLAGYEFTKHVIYEDYGKIIALRGLNIKNNSLLLNDVKYIDNSELNKLERSKLYIDDMMFTYIGTIGEVALIEENDRFYLAPNVSRIRFNRNEVIPKFILQYFTRDNFKEKVIKGYITSSSQPALTMENVRKFEIKFPSLQEQHKIASFLTLVDERLTLLAQQKEKLELYKKGVMQQIFSQKLRFKDENGNNYPDWEEKKLGDICEKKSSNISANTLEKNQGKFKIYGATGFLKNIDFYQEENEYISIVKDGAGVGRILLCDAKSSVLGTLDKIFPKLKIDIYFLFTTLENIDFTKYSTGSTIPHIYFKDYSKEKIKIPCLEEQQKIASFLSAIDVQIEGVIKKIEQTKLFKKGLLQQMFV
ncbi:MAG: restriction endonuclease subunit S [Flavobacterium sp.]|uniref:restriction endonuclease subunit S n=1 Tax=Flavobacterium sp. TaxID=239 RepID=UPI0025BEECA9|nr:restriction endonuclease subunit S [Flavobacterium sp.]MCK6607389.1 restriction endonuclease subunit S [Flavobacterium sp.]